MDPEFEEDPSFEVPQNGEPVGVSQDYSLSAQNDDLVFPESVQVNKRKKVEAGLCDQVFLSFCYCDQV